MKGIASDFEIEALYQYILERNATADEVEFYQKQKAKINDVLSAIYNSEEYDNLKENRFGRILSVDEINQVYVQFLDRKLSAEEEMFFLNHEIREPALMCNIMQSKEYEEKLEKKQGRSLTFGEVSEYYRILLGREMSDDEKTFFENNRVLEYRTVAGIVNSEEFRVRLETMVTETSRASHNREMDVKSELMDLLLGRPIRDYEKVLFKDIAVRNLVQELLDSRERQEYLARVVKDEVYTHKYAATTYKINWKKPAIFTCVYDCAYKDVVTEEVRKCRDGIWQDQYSLLKHFPNEGTFVDIGANIGVISCMIESKGWKGYSIEASPRNCECIRKAKTLNDLNIEIGEFAVSDQTQKLRFLENGPWGLIENNISKLENDIHDKAFDEVKYNDVQAYALNDWELTGLSKPKEITYIKMDIEGSEIAAITGMDELLMEYSYPIVFCESNGESQFHFGHTTEDLHKAFAKLGYHRYRWENGCLIQSDKKRFQKIYSTDYVFIKNMPEYLKELVRPEEDEGDDTERIIAMLCEGSFGEKVHVCSELKDYREYLSNATIKNKLMEYCKGSDATLKEATLWLEEEK